MPYCEVSKLARGVHSQDVYRVPDGRKYCASMGSRCFPCLFPISWQKTRPKSVRVQRRIGVRPLCCPENVDSGGKHGHISQLPHVCSHPEQVARFWRVYSC